MKNKKNHKYRTKKKERKQNGKTRIKKDLERNLENY